MKRTMQIAVLRLMFRPLFGWKDSGSPVPGEPVTFRSADGSRLAGVVVKAEAAGRGTVVLCHPFLKYGWRYFAKSGLIDALAAAGYDVLAFDFKGFGTSELAGAAFADDVKGAVAYAKARTPEQPVFILGTSFGGYHAAHAVAQGLDGGVAALVLDSVPPAVDRFFRKGATAPLMRWLSRSRWRHETGAAPLSEALQAVKTTPVLMLFGAEDECLRSGDLAALRAFPGAAVEVYPDCGHLEGFKKHQHAYLSRVSAFYEEGRA